jgi:AcrR family transcriptional regulator
MGQPDKAGRGRGGRAGEARRAPHQLPSGRHGLLPSFVAANQRERILSAVAQAAAELGYVEMSVEAITARAGVSRRTFYEHFKNKEDAFLATYDALLRQLVMHTQRAYLKETAVMERLRAGMSAYLQFLANEPEFARTCIVEVLAVGPRALARRNQAMRLFTEIIEDNIRELIPDFPRAAITAETIVGGIHEVVFNRILANRTDELPDLADDLLASILMLDRDAYLPQTEPDPPGHPAVAATPGGHTQAKGASGSGRGQPPPGLKDTDPPEDSRLDGQD